MTEPSTRYGQQNSWASIKVHLVSVMMAMSSQLG